jgi:hypothetical protein
LGSLRGEGPPAFPSMIQLPWIMIVDPAYAHNDDRQNQ